MATVSISTEYLAWDNTEAVNVTYHKNGKPLPEIPVANALRINPRTVFQIAAGIALTSNTVVWWLPIAQLGSDVDLDRDAIVRDSDDVEYHLQAATRVSLGNSYSHWNCTTVKEISED
ncbi:MAG TPA: hypothetical protein VLA12_00760 [Planctomycetaceae bacterium]|nr:hypothetical protein [Planctomycetaceae bacterium]